MKRPVLFALSAVFGLSAGFAGRSIFLSGQTPGQGEPRGGLSDGKDGRGGGRLKPGGASSGLAEDLRGALERCLVSERWPYWVAALEKAGPGDFAALARLAKDSPGALELLAERWVERDAEGLFALCRDPARAEAGLPVEDLGNLLIRLWPVRDPDAVLAALQSGKPLPTMFHAHLVDALFAKRPEQALEAMRNVTLAAINRDMLREIGKWAETDPRHAVEVMLANPRGRFTGSLLLEVGKVWARTKPEEAMAFARSHAGEGIAQMGAAAFRQWLEQDLPQASDWLAAQDGRERRLRLPDLMEAWGKVDAAAGLRWCLEHVREVERTDVLSRLVQGAAARNPAAAAALVTGMRDSAPGAVADAAAAFVTKTSGGENGWWPGWGWVEGVPKPEALTWLETLDGAARAKVARRLGESGWRDNFPQTYAEFLLTPAAGEADTELLAETAGTLTKVGPEEAIAWAGRVPEGSRDQVLTASFQAWSKAQPEAAMDWLVALPASDPRRADFYLGLVREVIPFNAYGLGSDNDAPLGTLKEAPGNLARLLSQDPAAAREAVGRLHLTAEDRVRVLGALRLKAEGG